MTAYIPTYPNQKYCVRTGAGEWTESTVNDVKVNLYYKADDDMEYSWACIEDVANPPDGNNYCTDYNSATSAITCNDPGFYLCTDDNSGTVTGTADSDFSSISADCSDMVFACDTYSSGTIYIVRAAADNA